MPIPRITGYPYRKKDEIRSFAEFQALLDNQFIIFHFKNNSFDLVHADNGNHFFAIRSPRQKGQILIIPPLVLLQWFNGLNDDEKETLPVAYRNYFQRQLDEWDDTLTDPNFAQLRAIQKTENQRNPDRRQNFHETIPLPYKNILHISKNQKWIDNSINTTLIQKLNNNTLYLHEGQMGSKKRRMAILPPIQDIKAPALFLTNKDLAKWYNTLLPNQKRQIPAVYHQYFAERCAQDNHLEEFRRIQHARISGANNIVNPININTPPPGHQPGFFTRAQQRLDYQPAPIAPTAVAQLARDNRWTIGTTANQGVNNETYKEVKSNADPGVRVEQYNNYVNVPANRLSSATAIMATRIASSASPLLGITNDQNEMQSLVILFHAALEEGKIPMLQPSTKDYAPIVTQAEVLAAVTANFPDYDANAKLQANLANQDAERAGIRTYYESKFPPARPVNQPA